VAGGVRSTRTSANPPALRSERVQRHADVNVFWDATPAVRVGLSGQYTKVKYLDDDQPHNVRVVGVLRRIGNPPQ
jgi:hypothetical protein